MGQTFFRVSFVYPQYPAKGGNIASTLLGNTICAVPGSTAHRISF